jgi:hypothetical protein
MTLRTRLPAISAMPAIWDAHWRKTTFRICADGQPFDFAYGRAMSAKAADRRWRCGRAGSHRLEYPAALALVIIPLARRRFLRHIARVAAPAAHVVPLATSLQCIANRRRQSLMSVFCAAPLSSRRNYCGRIRSRWPQLPQLTGAVPQADFHRTSLPSTCAPWSFLSPVVGLSFAR